MRVEQLGEKHMRVYGLRLPAKSLGWLVGMICFGLAILYPPLMGIPMYGSIPFNGLMGGWRYDFSYLLQTGGIFWHIVAYLRWQHMTFSPISLRTLVTLFAPYAFVPVTLPVCLLFCWRYGVDYAPRPSIWRGILAALCGLCVSLVLVFVLDQVGGRMVIYSTHISYTGNLAVRSVIGSVWNAAILQSFLLVLPCLGLGGLLAWRQRQLEARFAFARRVPVNTRSNE